MQSPRAAFRSHASSRISSETSSSDAARPCSFEEADCAVECGTGGRRVGEEVALQVRERLVPIVRSAGRKLLDLPARERSEILLRSTQRREGGPSRLVRKRDRHLCTPRKRLEQAPLCAGEVFESVGEDRSAVPGVELGPKPLDRSASKQVAIPQAEPIELGSIGGVQETKISLQLLGLEQAGLELRERSQKRVGKTRKPGGAAKAIQRCSGEDAAGDKCALRIARDGPGLGGAECELAEDVVERPDRAREQGAFPAQEIAFDAVDVRPVRDDQDRIAVDRREVGLEEARDLAGFRRPEDESQAHLSMVVRASDTPADEISGKSGVSPALSQLVRRYCVADFGRRPRRATWRPPIFSASASVTSSSRTPLRASWNVMRIVAPLPSAISAPEISDTSTVLRATGIPPWRA